MIIVYTGVRYSVILFSLCKRQFVKTNMVFHENLIMVFVKAHKQHASKEILSFKNFIYEEKFRKI